VAFLFSILALCITTFLEFLFAHHKSIAFFCETLMFMYELLTVNDHCLSFDFIKTNRFANEQPPTFDYNNKNKVTQVALVLCPSCVPVKVGLHQKGVNQK
jgi:hypothetical protein